MELNATGVCHTDTFSLFGDDPEGVFPAIATRGRTSVPRIVDWFVDGKIKADDLITHTMPFDEINTAVDLMHKGESIGSVVIY